jgi:UDP-N-acetyl-D-glucosamine dehydrogenase
MKISIIGLGYVGLPLACLCAGKGMDVHGVDSDEEKISKISRGISPIDDKDLKEKVKKLKDKIKVSGDSAEAVMNSSVVIVCVPTPVDDNNQPDLRALQDACRSISENLKQDSLVVIESTIFPGTVEEMVLPALKKSNVKFYLAHCPERMDPGNSKFTINNIPRVAGGIDDESTKRAVEFYKKIIDADIVPLSSVKAAEATKIMENTFRDVNIAFVNEMAMSFDKAGIDILEVIKGASTKPFGFMPHYPGAGVGGHCIKIDPYYLISKAKELGFEHKFLSLARDINEGMPFYTVSLLEQELEKINKGVHKAKVGVLGLAYKANVDDTRESPALKIIEILNKKSAVVSFFDPHIPRKSNVKGIKELLENSDFIVLATDHKEFKGIDINLLKKNNIKIVIDGRNCLDKEKIKALGIVYRGIGRK